MSVRWFFRGTAALAVCAALVWVYLAYFTPQDRAVRSRLSEADDKSKAAIETRLKPLTELFAKGRKGSKAFAEDALSWEGKWELVKGLVGNKDSHRAYLSASFNRHVFSPEDLRAAIESVIRAYLDDVEGFESELLVRLRADVANLADGSDTIPRYLQGDEEFRREYQKLTELVMAELHTDLGVTVGREAGMLIVTEVTTQAAIQMGVSTGVLGAGAASTVVTLGVGLIVSIIIDYMLDEILKAAGYDPAAKIEAVVRESIDKLERALLCDPDFFSGDKKGSLRQRLENLHEGRSKLRRETIKRLLKEEGGR